MNPCLNWVTSWLVHGVAQSNHGFVGVGEPDETFTRILEVLLTTCHRAAENSLAATEWNASQVGTLFQSALFSGFSYEIQASQFRDCTKLNRGLL